MCDFKPGDEVVCVDDTDLFGVAVKGGVYLCEAMETLPLGFLACTACRKRNIVIRLANTVHPLGWLFCSCQFRKVQRRDLTAWLETATDFEEPKRVKEPAQ